MSPVFVFLEPLPIKDLRATTLDANRIQLAWDFDVNQSDLSYFEVIGSILPYYIIKVVIYQPKLTSNGLDIVVSCVFILSSGQLATGILFCMATSCTRM